ncbi:MAG: hypothetical protein DCC75_02930 [Proteobacteria bacterium]|nr:MAG: hypothetical protein DCC75_02930 [Pseudomonadota bacterium]
MRMFYLVCLVWNASLCFYDTAQADSPWKIGMVLCLSGECAFDGHGALKGAQLAADELNKGEGVLGRKIQLVPEDTAEAVSGAKAVSAFQKLLLDPEIKYFIGPSWTPGGLALAPLAARRPDLIITSPSLGAAEFHKAGDNIFNARGVDESASRALARLAIDKGWLRVAIWSSQQPWEQAQGNFFEAEFKKIGGEVTLKIEGLPTITQLKTEAAKVLASKPQAVFFSIVVQQGIAAKALRQLGSNLPIIATYIGQTGIKEAQGALEGALMCTIANASPSFVERFKNAYPEEKAVEAIPAIGYDALMMYAKAVTTAGSFETAKVGHELRRMNYKGESGSIKFDSEGGAIRETQFMLIVSDKQAPLELVSE